MKRFLSRFWKTLSRPSVHFSLGFLTLGGFLAGILFWGAFNTALEATNTEQFCIGCHEMQATPYEQLKTPFTTPIAQASAQCVPIVMCHMTGPTRWAARWRPRKRCGAGFSVLSIRRKNTKPSIWQWRNGNGAGSKPTTPLSAAIAICSTRWTLPCRRPGLPLPTRQHWPAAVHVLIATRGLRTSCRRACILRHASLTGMF